MFSVLNLVQNYKKHSRRKRSICPYMHIFIDFVSLLPQQDNHLKEKVLALPVHSST